MSPLRIGALSIALLAPTAHAGLLWHDESLSYLWGDNFRVNPPTQQTFTFEHASGWSWGDLFLFVDQINYQGRKDPGQGGSTYYGEFQPRLSLGKLSGTDLSFGPIKDVLIASSVEFGEGDTESYLLGPGFDLDIPGFDYFQLNLYYRKPDGHRVPAGAWQITPAWSYTVPLGNSDLLIDGYIDWVVNNKDASSGRRNQADYHANLHFNPQIKYDLGKALGYGAKHLYVGVEYDYWSDKYGIEDSKGFRTEQNTTSFLLKYHF
jgi:nucleoside-specific outer membrane channel protein Tsx